MWQFPHGSLSFFLFLFLIPFLVFVPLLVFVEFFVFVLLLSFRFVFFGLVFVPGFFFVFVSPLLSVAEIFFVHRFVLPGRQLVFLDRLLVGRLVGFV